MEVTRSIFFQKHNVTVGDLESYLSEALSRGGDYADLYFEYRINHSIVLEEQIIKSATKSVNLGVGVRVVSGEKTGYAYSDDLNRDNVIKAARTAAFIANASSKGGKIQVPTGLPQERNLYAIPLVPAELEITQKIALLEQADRAARDFDPRIKQVQASYIDETKHGDHRGLGAANRRGRGFVCLEWTERSSLSHLDDDITLRCRTCVWKLRPRCCP